MTVIKDWVYGMYDPTKKTTISLGWKTERDQMYREAFKIIKDKKREDLISVVGHSINIIRKNLAFIDVNDVELELKEVKQVSDIATGADKLVKLEDGDPTEIKKNIQYTENELRQTLEELAEIDKFGSYNLHAKDEEPIN